MNPLLCSALMLTVVLQTSVCRADQFQIIDRETGDYVRDARLSIAGDTFYTDRYGRVDIDLEPGTYDAEIRVRGEERRVRMSITGSDYMEQVHIDDG